VSRFRAAAALAYGLLSAAAATLTLVWWMAILAAGSIPGGRELADRLPAVLRLDLLQPAAATGSPTAVARAAGIDLALLLLFSIQHSGMARRSFKRLWNRLFPELLQPSTYNLASAAALALMLVYWQPLPGVAWDFDSWPAEIGVFLAFAAGVGVAVWASFTLESADLSGLPQIRAYIEGREYPGPPLQIPRVYRLVRHPMWLGAILLVWAAPQMTAGRFLMASATTVYALVGAWLTERDLVARFGEAYRQYQGRTPMLIPRPSSLAATLFQPGGDRHGD
jgi:protein-S-isoprenylcysteine O-methyltransferase Ste14